MRARAAAEQAAAQTSTEKESGSAVQVDNQSNNSIEEEADKASNIDAVQAVFSNTSAAAQAAPAGQIEHAEEVCDALCPDNAFYSAVNDLLLLTSPVAICQ